MTPWMLYASEIPRLQPRSASCAAEGKLSQKVPGASDTAETEALRYVGGGGVGWMEGLRSQVRPNTHMVA